MLFRSLLSAFALVLFAGPVSAHDSTKEASEYHYTSVGTGIYYVQYKLEKLTGDVSILTIDGGTRGWFDSKNVAIEAISSNLGVWMWVGEHREPQAPNCTTTAKNYEMCTGAIQVLLNTVLTIQTEFVYDPDFPFKNGKSDLHIAERLLVTLQYMIYTRAFKPLSYTIPGLDR